MLLIATGQCDPMIAGGEFNETFLDLYLQPWRYLHIMRWRKSRPRFGHEVMIWLLHQETFKIDLRQPAYHPHSLTIPPLHWVLERLATAPSIQERDAWVTPIRELVRAGADVHGMMMDGKTPLDVLFRSEDIPEHSWAETWLLILEDAKVSLRDYYQREDDLHPHGVVFEIDASRDERLGGGAGEGRKGLIFDYENTTKGASVRWDWSFDPEEACILGSDSV